MKRRKLMKFPKATIVHLDIKRGNTGLFYGTSKDLKGLLIAEPSADLVREKTPHVIADMYHAAGVDHVEVLTINHNTFSARPTLMGQRLFLPTGWVIMLTWGKFFGIG